MNRRDFLSLIPSISILTPSVPSVDLRKQYMEYVIPDRYLISKWESEEIIHYTALYIDRQDGIQYHYSFDSKFHEHRFRISVYGDDPFESKVIMEDVADSLTEVVSEFDENLVLPETNN